VGAWKGGLGGLRPLPVLPAPPLRACAEFCSLQGQQWQNGKWPQAQWVGWAGWVGAVVAVEFKKKGAVTCAKG